MSMSSRYVALGGWSRWTTRLGGSRLASILVAAASLPFFGDSLRETPVLREAHAREMPSILMELGRETLGTQTNPADTLIGQTVSYCDPRRGWNFSMRARRTEWLSAVEEVPAPEGHMWALVVFDVAPIEPAMTAAPGTNPRLTISDPAEVELRDEQGRRWRMNSGLSEVPLYSAAREFTGVETFVSPDSIDSFVRPFAVASDTQSLTLVSFRESCG